MIISFDLDDTLLAKNKFQLEKTNLFQQFFGIEGLRKGTIELFKEIKIGNINLYLYNFLQKQIKNKVDVLFLWNLC